MKAFYFIYHIVLTLLGCFLLFIVGVFFLGNYYNIFAQAGGRSNSSWESIVGCRVCGDLLDCDDGDFIVDSSPHDYQAASCQDLFAGISRSGD